MKKHWITTVKSYCRTYETLDEAVARAKLMTGKDQGEYVVYEAVQITKTPVPDIEMTVL